MDGDGSSSDLDISTDINGCIKSLDDDIEGPVKASNAKGTSSGDTQSSRSSSSSSSSSSSDSSSSSSSKSSKASSSHKKLKEKPPEPKVPVIAAPPITDRVLYPARLYKKSSSGIDKSHKSQHRSRSRSRGPRSVRESGYRTDGSATSDKSLRRRKSRAPSAPRASAFNDIDLDLRGLQLSTEPSTSVKLTKRNVNLMARKNDTNNNTNGNGVSSSSSSGKVRPTALNLELNRRLLEHKMDLNGRTGSFSSSYKTGFKGFKSSQSFQELTATSRVMAPSWTAEEKVTSSSKPMKYAKSLPRTIKSRRSSVASRAGSVRSTASTLSRMRRASTPAVIKNNEYVVAQVAEITAALAKCSISTAKNSKSSKISSKVIQSTTTSKKKKTVSKRRSKKNVDNDWAPAADDHKLPLKKRHFLISEEKVSNGNVKRKRQKKMAAGPPSGIFEPTNQQIPEDKPSSFEVFDIMCPTIHHVQEVKPVQKSVVDNILTKMDPTGNKRKRRRANRTGFPNPKRPKKKVVNDTASETSSVVKKRNRKPKAPPVPPEENLSSLSLRQLQLKQQKEIELKNNQEQQKLQQRTIRARAKSVCHEERPPTPEKISTFKRKRRQTIFVEHKEEIPQQPVASAAKKISEKIVEKVAEKSFDKLMLKSLEKSSKIGEKNLSKTSSKLSEKSEGKFSEKSGSKNHENLETKLTEKSGAKFSEKSGTKLHEKSGSKLHEKPSSKSLEKSTPKSSEKQAQKSYEKISSKSSEKSAPKSQEKSLEKSSTKLPEKSIEKPVKKRRQTMTADVPAKKPKKLDLPPLPETPTPTKPDPPVKMVPKNVYNGDTQKRAFVPSLKGTVCRCAPNPCGESCLNRSMFIECDVSICGKSCTNTAIQTGGLLNKDVEKFRTERKGFGVRTKKDIPKKTLILEYTGEVLFLEAFRQRMQTIYKSDNHHYCLELSGGLVLDGHRMGSLCRFVNHSCKPNCGMAKIYVEGLPRMILQAEEDIEAGTELTYDYKFDNFEDMTPQQCFCGAESCRGTLSAQMKAPRRASMSAKDNETAPKRGGRKGRATTTNAKANLCFLMRNLRRVEKHHPELMAFYQNIKNGMEGDPKVGFAFVSKSHESSPPAPDIPEPPSVVEPELKPEPEPEPVFQQPLSEQSQVLWQIIERLEKVHASKFEEIKIPPAPKTGHSNHDRISLPLTFEDIKLNVKLGHYDLHPLLFHYNMKILLDNAVKFWGVNCPQFETMLKLRATYKEVRMEMIEEIKKVWSDEFFINAMMDKIVKKPARNRKKVPEKQDEEDIVNCHCGRYLEEGLMIQCQKCLTWQHVDCAGADGKAENYTCARCENKSIQMEIFKKGETTADGHQCYLTLMRGNLQLRVGDAVYVLRDIPIDASVKGGPRHTFETIGEVNYSECDIVRVETLYKDAKGDAFVLGHHYLRPNEVYHEPSRKFYTNELMRTSIFESIPINLVIDTCWVLDPTTYFKGRPINSVEQHVYICEYKVDKQARVFSVIKKSSRTPISIKPYAFYKFEEQLRQRRNHLPHDIDHVIPKKIKKEQQLQTKKDKRSDVSHLPLLPLPLHRQTPRNVLSRQEKMKMLEKFVKKIKSRATSEKSKKFKEGSDSAKPKKETSDQQSKADNLDSKQNSKLNKNFKEKRKPGRPAGKKKNNN